MAGAIAVGNGRVAAAGFVEAVALSVCCHFWSRWSSRQTLQSAPPLAAVLRSCVIALAVILGLAGVAAERLH